MNFRLVVERGRTRKVFPIRTGQAVLGRARGNTVRIPSAAVSRRHCQLRVDRGLVMLEDLESVNGTFLNGRRINAVEVVRPGDRIEVGPVTFVVEYELTPAALERLDRQEAPGELLEALADGELIEIDEADVLPLDEDVAEPIEVEPLAAFSDDDGPIKADFDFDASPWQIPDGGDLRDILARIEEEPPPPPKNPGKKKK